MSESTLRATLSTLAQAIDRCIHGAYDTVESLLSPPEKLGAHASLAEALSLLAVKLEAREYELQVTIEELRRARQKLSRENRKLRSELQVAQQAMLPLSDSPAMAGVMRIVERVAATDTTVLIQGESGTGKEVVARLIHARSPRRERELIALNCAALPESLLDAELFGIEKGTATGVEARPGKFEAADGGTLFLDEIGDMPLATQAHVLRAIQEREVVRVGSNRPRKVDIRLLAATHQDLATAVQTGRFREDLYYRLQVVVLRLPPLRERPSDILPLATFFLGLFRRLYDRQVSGLTGEAESLLVSHTWPGNIRELRNAVERALLLCDGERVQAEDFDLTPASAQAGSPAQPGATILASAGAAGNAAASGATPTGSTARVGARHRSADPLAASDGSRALRLGAEEEKRLLEETLARCDGNRTQAATALGIHRETLRLKMKRYGIS